MEGSILHYSKLEQSGIIKGLDGKRVPFAIAEWKSASIPQKGENVDFVLVDNNATEIYSTKQTESTFDIEEKINYLKNSGAGEKLNVLLSSGIHNTFGFITTLIVLVTLFFPIIKIPLLGSYSLLTNPSGKLLCILLITLALFFYGGVTRLYIKILATTALTILFFKYYNIFSELLQANDLFSIVTDRRRGSGSIFHVITWSCIINFIASTLLAYSAFYKKYSKNDQAI